ncbi:hypothetical protein DFJ77DRAFT_527507 [Powellomyces hirtus]|nr:hypothetical protein DFJ77DRAFT_527507 [Powellomyces hirtus]
MVKEHRKTLPGGLYLPVSDSAELENANHKKEISGRLLVADVFLTLLASLKHALNCVRTVKAVHENDGVETATIVLGLQAIGWFRSRSSWISVYPASAARVVSDALILYIAFSVTRSYPAPPRRTHAYTFYFYVLTTAAEAYILHVLHVEHAHHSVVALAQLALIGTCAMLLIEVFQMYRKDSYGTHAMAMSECHGGKPTRPVLDEKDLWELQESDDLWELQESDRSASINAGFKENRRKNPKRSLLRDMCSSIKYFLLYQFTCAFLYSVLALGGPFFLTQLVGWVADPNRVMTTGWLLLFGLTFAGVARAIVGAQMFHIGRRASLRSMESLSSECTLKLCVARQMVARAPQMEKRIKLLHPLANLLQSLFYTVGWSATAGVIVMHLSGPLGGFLGKLIATVQDEWMTTTDKRVDTANETPFVTFVIYTTVAGKQLSPQTAFTAIALLSQVSQQMQMLPYLIMEITQVKVSYGRIAKFLQEFELESTTAKTLSNLPPISISVDWDSETNTVTEPPVVGFQHGTFTFFGNDEGESASVPGKTDNETVIDVPASVADSETPSEERVSRSVLRDLHIDFP